VEQALADCVRQGKWLDLAEGEVVDEAAMRSWGESRTCRAAVIRDILRGRLAADPDPHGLRLRGARISGRLDLENLTTDVNLELSDCLLEEGIDARGARLAGVGLAGCQIEHPAEPPLDADRLTCTELVLDESRIIARTGKGAVCLGGANVGGQLSCTRAALRNDSGPALSADGLQVGRAIVLRGGLTATGHGGLGAVRLPGAHISGNLECDGASLRNDSGPALSAASLQVGRAMFLRGGFTATGHGDAGTVRLTGAHIGGQFSWIGASLRNDSGPALSAASLQVGQGMYLSGGFTATGSGEDGAVRLTGAHIGGQLSCAGAALRNDSGPALQTDSLQVGQGMYLSGGFTATGHGDAGTVSLTGAHIGSQLVCTGAELRNDSGPALNAYDLQVGWGMYLSGGFTVTRGGNDVTVDLRNTRVGGAFVFAPARLEHAADPHRRLAVDGLTYTGVPEPVSARGWLRLLREGTPRYAAQPYQRLAAGCRALGDERQARQILMAQRDDQLARARPRPHWTERLWGKFTKVTLGYGYKPWRALLFLAAVGVTSCLLAVVLGAHGALTQTSQTTAPGQPCTVIQRVSVGMDLGLVFNLPVGTRVARANSDCGLAKNPASVAAAWLIASGWVLRLLAFGFAALFIASFTGAIRKS
jgi:hypothetical protein